MANFQDEFYGANLDYRHGSPHLSYPALNDALITLLRREIDRLAERGLPLDILEIGAGHGGFTEPMLAAGCSVTTIEMSRASADRIAARFAHNPSLTSLHSPDGDLPPGLGRFSLATCISVLHHIPDYLSAVREILSRLRPGGSLVALQDPLWYARVSSSALRFNRVGYLSWRMVQGDLARGLSTQLRRQRGILDESNPSDMVEYHVIRDGVDEDALETVLSEHFGSVEIVRYWSNQSALFQRAGDALGLQNTFGIIASRKLT